MTNAVTNGGQGHSPLSHLAAILGGMATVYRLKAREGAGWVRELVDGGPIVTADRAEARQWPSSAEARRARPRGGWLVVAGEPSAWRRRGL